MREPRSVRVARGFTLVELLVVIGIIALLVGILMPTLAKARRAGERAACASNLRQVAIGIQMYAADDKGTFPAGVDPVSTSPLIWTWMGRGFRPLVERYVVRSGNNPGVFWCPADQTSTDQYDSTSYAYSMSFYHSAAQIDAMTTVAANYSGPVPPSPQKLGRVRYSSEKVMVGEWLSVHAPFPNDGGWFTPGGKHSYAFADGHVVYLDWRDVAKSNDGLANPNLTKGGIGGRDVR